MESAEGAQWAQSHVKSEFHFSLIRLVVRKVSAGGFFLSVVHFSCFLIVF